MWVKGIGLSSYFGVEFEVCCGSLDERPSLVFMFSLEYPLAVFDGLEVFVLDPFFAFVGMSSFGPPPQCLEDSMVCIVEGLVA